MIRFENSWEDWDQEQVVWGRVHDQLTIAILILKCNVVSLDVLVLHAVEGETAHLLHECILRGEDGHQVIEQEDVGKANVHDQINGVLILFFIVLPVLFREHVVVVGAH